MQYLVEIIGVAAKIAYEIANFCLDGWVFVGYESS